MFLSNRGSFRPETSGAYTLRRRGRRRPKSGSAIGACAVARLAGSGGPIGDYYGSANITDITEFRIPAGKAYLSAVVDCFDGRPAGWRIGPSPTAALANGSLADAVAARRAGARTVVHSDRGGHYRWPGWVALCEGAGLVRSMSAKGCSPDNAACEGFFGRLKNEFFHCRDWEGVPVAEFGRRLDAYLRYYCSGRIKRSLGWLSPDEYRASLGYAV